MKLGLRLLFLSCFFLCLCVSVVKSHAQAPTTPTNLGPVRTTFQDYVQQNGALANPPAGICRAYYLNTGVIVYFNSSGSPCGPSVGSCPNCVVTDGSGNATIAGNFTALELILSGLGPLDVTTPCNTVSAPPSNFGLLGMGAGCVPVIYPTALGAVVPLAYQDGSGNVKQNALTATALAATPTQCSGNYATGIQANGTANCDTSTYVLVPTIADPGATGSSLALFGTTTQVQAHINGGSVVTLLRKDTSYSTWTCSLLLYASQGYCNWTLPVGVNVVQLDLAQAVAFTSCTTFPIVAVYDATASANVGSFTITTAGSSTFFYTAVTGSTAVASGHQLRINVTAGNTCTPSLSTTNFGAVATVTYQMN